MIIANLLLDIAAIECAVCTPINTIEQTADFWRTEGWYRSQGDNRN